jgi:hypothetical protein
MAGKAARVAVEPSGSERDTMERPGAATWPIKGWLAVETSGKRATYQIEIPTRVSAFHYRKAI